MTAGGSIGIVGAARAAFLAATRGQRRSVDWQTCTLHDVAGADGPHDRTVVLADPLDPRPPQLAAFLDELAGLS